MRKNVLKILCLSSFFALASLNSQGCNSFSSKIKNNSRTAAIDLNRDTENLSSRISSIKGNMNIAGAIERINGSITINPGMGGSNKKYYSVSPDGLVRTYDENTDGVNNLAKDFKNDLGITMPKTLNELKSDSSLLVKKYNNYYTGVSFCCNDVAQKAVDVNIKFRYDPKFADLKISLSNVCTTGVTNSLGLGVYFEESYAVSCSVDIKETVSVGESHSFGTAQTIDMAGYPAGDYGIYMQTYFCTKYYLKINSSGKVVGGMRASKCPADYYDYIVVPEQLNK